MGEGVEDYNPILVTTQGMWKFGGWGGHGRKVWSAFVFGIEGALRVVEQVEFIQTTLVINPSVIHIP